MKSKKDIVAFGSSALLGICPVCKQDFKKVRQQKYCSDNCRGKHFYYHFKDQNGITYHKRQRKRKQRLKLVGRYKPGIRTRLTGGVSSDGKKYTAHICVNGVFKKHLYSIAKFGEKGARLAASLQRMAWLIELGVWSPKDGDPFKILSYSDTFKGNDEYADSVLDRRELSSPYIAERDDED